jgi:ubiquinone/menaquinone biosynthesis C-methylase UbiE
MSVFYHSQTARKETLHTLSLVAPHLDRGMSVLDVGCGDGYVIEELAARGATRVFGADIVDLRRNKQTRFALYDGRTLPFPADSFDLVMLSFVLHHVPDEAKIALLDEALRVCRGKVFIAEDTPRTSLDRLFSEHHGRSYRKRIHSAARYGFLSATEWRWLFRGMGLEPETKGLSRFCRSIFQPFSRTIFVLRKQRRGHKATRRPSDAVGETHG